MENKMNIIDIFRKRIAENVILLSMMAGSVNTDLNARSIPLPPVAEIREPPQPKY
jgi:hypothetical protein